MRLKPFTVRPRSMEIRLRESGSDYLIEEEKVDGERTVEDVRTRRSNMIIMLINGRECIKI